MDWQQLKRKTHITARDAGKNYDPCPAGGNAQYHNLFGKQYKCLVFLFCLTFMSLKTYSIKITSEVQDIPCSQWQKFENKLHASQWKGMAEYLPRSTTQHL